MKLILFAAILMMGFTTLRAVEESDFYKLIDCGAEKAVLLKGKMSPDRRYAVGWTIRQKRKGVKPVDWSAWNDDESGFFEFIERYDVDNPDATKASYEMVNCVIDLKEKKLLILPSEWPYWPGKNRGHLDVVWSSQFKNCHYALIQNDARFYTHDLWLVVIDRSGMHQRDITPQLDKSVRNLLRKKKPSSYDRYGTFFPLHNNSDGNIKDAVFKSSSSAEIPFSAEIPKSMDDAGVEGTIIVHLPDGDVRSISTKH